jgi:hypothetical protein
VLLNVLKPEITVIGTPLMIVILLLSVFSTQEFVLLEQLVQVLLQLKLIKRCKCATGLMQQRYMIRVTVKTVML